MNIYKEKKVDKDLEKIIDTLQMCERALFRIARDSFTEEMESTELHRISLNINCEMAYLKDLLKGE